MVLHNSNQNDTYLVQADMTAASPRSVFLEQILSLYEVLVNLHSSCSLQPLPFYLHFILTTDKKMICWQSWYFQFQFYVIHIHALVDNYIRQNRQNADIILQLKYVLQLQ